MSKKTILKRVIASLIISSFLFTAVSPIFAQTTTNVLPDWRNGGNRPELREKIQALGDIVVQDVPIPVLFGIAPTNLTKNFGDPRSGGRTHEGLDIMAPLGTPVVSPTKAVVTGMGNQELAGNYVYTRNPGGETFGYMHFDSFAPGITVGTVLEVGDIIGFVGKTGNAQWGDPHLHFEIRKDVATDPYPRLTKEFTLQERITYITKILTQVPNSGDLATFLVSKYKSTFQLALNQNIVLPPAITLAMNSNTTVTNPASTPTPAVTPTVTKTTGTHFNRSLQMGMSGDDVQALQKFLNQSGFTVATTGAGSLGHETKTFGTLTRAAVIKYQNANNIAPAIGFFGPITRASANARVLALNIKL